MAYTIRTPDGKGYQMEAPDEGKLFKDTGGQVGMIKGGQFYKLNAEQELANKYNLGSIASTGDSPAIAWNNWLRSQGLTTGGAVQQRAYQELGIDLTKLPEYNTADLYQYGVFTGTPQSLSGADAKSGYDMGAFAKAATTPTELTGNAIPKEISGVGGPKDLQGNLITPEKYAEYGITNTQPQTPTFQTTAGVSPTTAGQPTTNYWKSPSGTIVGVSAGSEAENNFKNLGWTQSTSAEEVAGRQVQNISPTGEIQTTTGGQTTGQAPTGGQAPVSGQNPQTQWVNDYYQKYFDRPATQAELDNWGKETPQNLEAFLKQEAQRYGYTSKTFQTEESQRLQSAYDKIDGSNLPPELKQLYKDVVKNYPPGIEFDANEILNTFQKIKDETIDPQYRNYIAQAEKGLTQNLADIEQQRVSELEQERSQAGLAIRQAKEGLEKAGMTFTGKAIETLGSEAAIPQGATGAETTPTQEPFGGLFYEGLVPQYNRLSSSSSQARYESALKSLGLSAEQQLGTAGVSKFGISGYTPVGGTTGTLEEQKKQTEASTLQQLLNNYQEKQKSLTNLTFSS
ncbi:MAG: hypothetical protein WC473_06085 [Patescibacteria group bacterium]